MRFRKLRIAWSVGWGSACALVIVLWVRSYTTLDGLRIQHASGEDIELFTELGQLVFSPGSGTNLLSFHIEQHPVMEFDAGEPDDSGQHRESGLRFQVFDTGANQLS